jgi:hypothetical protein
MELAVVRFEGVSSCQQARSRTIPVALRIVHDAPLFAPTWFDPGRMRRRPRGSCTRLHTRKKKRCGG